MEVETIRLIQGYAYWFCTLILTILLCAYIWHLYRSQQKGFDYEKYSRLALDDKLDDAIIEKREHTKREEGELNGMAKS